jgi:tRNA uridine 5-carboxymethylaminomethyl modification enzyme
LIDDLVTKGTDAEPYRMFTSRAEYRLLLREDNADLRLTEIGCSIGLAGEQARRRLEEKTRNVTALTAYLARRNVRPSNAANTILAHLGSAALQNAASLAQLLRRPEISFGDLKLLDDDLPEYPSDVQAQVETDIKYEGYIGRQLDLVERFRKAEQVRLPDDIDYGDINGLSNEVREKLSLVRPQSLGQAARIVGVTPAAISLLAIYLKRRKIA